MIKSMYGADFRRVRKNQQFRVALANMKRAVEVDRKETCFRGKGTPWKGSLSSRDDTAR